MDKASQRSERNAITLILGLIAVVVVFIAACVAGYHFFQKWQSDRLVRRAQSYLEWHDYKSAVLSARRAYQVNPKNFLAARVLAEAAEAAFDPGALGWREEALRSSTEPIPDGIALARTALLFDKVPVGKAALAKLPAEAASRADFHAVQAQLAIAQKDPITAEKEYAEAVRLDSGNKVYRLNLAVFQLQSPSPDTRAAASKLLQEFMGDPTLRVAAARAMRDYALQRKDYPALLEITTLLSGYPEASFRDRISHLQILRAMDQPEFTSQLTELETEAAADPNKLNEMLSWMSVNRMAVLAISWIKTLPPEMLNKRPIPVAVAECYLAASDWDGLTNWCKKDNWQDLEYFRHAYLARSARERDDNLAFESEWNQAIGATGTEGERIFTLQQAVMRWGWKKEGVDLLWRLRNDPLRKAAAMEALYQYYASQDATGDMYRVAAEISEMRKDDTKAANNLAQLALLLRVDLSRAHDVARDLYNRNPKDPTYASTYAYSLFVQGKPSQAVQVMSELPRETVERPELAVYYGIFLAAAGDNGKAAEYLARGSSAKLLPEEKAQYEAALKAVKPAA